MSLAESLRALLPARVLGRTDEYVVIEDESDRSVFATVHGEESHEVTLQLTPPASFSTSCTCPIFRRTQACRHVWAVVREIDERKLALARAVAPDADASLIALDPRQALWRARLDEVHAQLARSPSDPWKGLTVRPRRPGVEIVYIVDLDDTHAGHGLVVRPFWRERQRSGRWSARKPFDPDDRDRPPVTDPLDRRLFRALSTARRSRWTESAHLSNYGGRGAYWLGDDEATTVLPLLGESGRAFLHHRNEVAARPFVFDPGEPWAFGVRLDRGRGSVRLTGFLAREDERIDLGQSLLVLRDFVFCDQTVARLDPRGAWPLLETLLSDGGLEGSAADADELVERLVALPAHPLLEGDGLRLVEATRPGCKVLLESVEGEAHERVRIVFRYGQVEVGPSDPRGALRDGEGNVVRRLRQAEREILERVLAAGGEPSDERGVDARVERGAVDDFALALLEQGCSVELDGRPCRVTSTAHLAVRDSGEDWALLGELDFGEARAPLSRVLDSLDDGLVRLELDDGSIGLLPPIVRREWALLAAVGARAEDGLRFRSSQAWLLDRLLAERPGIRWGARFAALRGTLSGFDGLEPRREPAGFRGTLRTYQRVGLAWFAFLESVGFGGCLADEMGLGKTVMVLALFESRRGGRHGPHLVVVPRSLLFNWRREAERFTPELSVLDHTGPNRDAAAIAEHDLVLTTYGTLRSDAAVLSTIDFDYVVLDEAQAIKNPRSHSAKAARSLRARQRLTLSGTPIENHLRELWSLFEFLNPGMLGRARGFRELFAGRNDRRLDVEGQRLLSSALRPFLLRRTKEEVVPDLPPRVEQTLWIEMDPEQRAEYEALRRHYRALLAESEGRPERGVSMLRALLRLRQAACHPGLLDPERDGETSAKLDVLLPHLEEIVEAGRKVLVFSQFARHLAVVRRHLDPKGLGYAYLDGQTADREAVVTRFREDPACPLFLMTLKAGGLGLNLVEADYVFLLDPWWNPAAEAQAIDRAHRIGRTQAVMAYRLVARDTVEERVIELQKEKRALAAAVLPADGKSDSALLKKLSLEDLQRLFG